MFVAFLISLTFSISLQVKISLICRFCEFSPRVGSYRRPHDFNVLTKLLCPIAEQGHKGVPGALILPLK